MWEQKRVPRASTYSKLKNNPRERGVLYGIAHSGFATDGPWRQLIGAGDS